MAPERAQRPSHRGRPAETDVSHAEGSKRPAHRRPRTETDVARAERAIARLAARQHGLVTTAQLLTAGLSHRAIATRVAQGRLHRVHRGVYRVGPLPAPLEREAAALLACGSAAVLGLHAAAALWELRAAPRGPVDVVLAAGDRRDRPGIRVHLATLAPGDVTRRNGLRVTRPARTLLDLAAVLSARELARAVEEAQARKLTSRTAMLDVVERSSGHRGVAALRAAVRARDAPAFTRSEAERRLVELARAARLPRPATNASLAGFEVDALWREQRLALEVDSWEFHGTRAAFERDRRRDADLLVAGYRVLRVTWRQLVDEPIAVAARIAGALRER